MGFLEQASAKLLATLLAAIFVLQIGAPGFSAIAAGTGETYYSTSGADVYHGSEYDDYIHGNAGADMLYGEGGHDHIYAGDGDDLAYGGFGDDSIEGGAGNDTLYGENGDDVLYGNAGSDVFYGGSGDDELNGGTGHDTFHFELGDGQDIINCYGSGAADQDSIIFGAGITPDDVELIPSTRYGTAAISIKNTNDYIVIEGYYTNANYRPGEIVFADGTIWSRDFLSALSIYTHGTNGSDTLEAGALNSVVLGYGGNDRIGGSSKADSLYGGADDDTIYAAAGNDILIGGAGDDSLSGEGGNDTYVFFEGYGNDRVYDDSGSNKLMYASVASISELVVANSGYSDVTLTNATTGEVTTLVDFRDSSALRNYKVTIDLF